MSSYDDLLEEVRRLREAQERANEIAAANRWDASVRAAQERIDAAHRCLGSPTGEHVYEGGMVNGQLQLHCRYCPRSDHDIANSW